jgi:Flp pilus assembly protein TadG
MRKFKRAGWDNCRGTTAVEFGIILPAVITLFVGTLYLCMGLLVVGSLQFAVEDAARCASVNTTTCSSSSAITTYASGRYFGPGSAPTFTYSATGCGHTVSGSTNYAANLGFKTVTIPISAAACFP